MRPYEEEYPYDYPRHYVDDFLMQMSRRNAINTPNRERFATLLNILAYAMSDIEAVDAGRLPAGAEDHAIDVAFDVAMKCAVN